MNAYRCDRCGKMYSKYKQGSLSLRKYNFLYGGPQDHFKPLDLCEDCQRELNDWWNKGKKEGGEHEAFT